LFAGRWWAVILRGVAAAAFGVLAFAWPHLTISKLMLLFGGYALAQGVFSLITAIGKGRQAVGRFPLAFEGVIGIWIGTLALRASTFSSAILVMMISLWAVATGVLRIAEAIRLRKQLPDEIWLSLSGVVTVLFGLMLMWRISAAPVRLAWMIAGYALLLGLLEILLGLELRGARRRLEPTAT
jgi:uncharacterized membrane protein HdeD (DUF308 family)